MIEEQWLDQSFSRQSDVDSQHDMDTSFAPDTATHDSEEEDEMGN